MKYFGEYLVSKGIISNDVLVDTLIEQVNSLPSIADLVRRKSLLKTEVFMNAFNLQAEKKIEFKQACSELKVWTPEIEETVRKELESLRTPLGELLIRRSVIDMQTITKALDEFLSRIEKAPDTTKVETPVQQPIVASGEPVPEPLLVKPSLEPVSENPTQLVEASPSKVIDPILLEEFCTYLNDARIDALKNLFEGLITSGEDSEITVTLLKKLLVEFRAIKGLSKFVKLDRIEALLICLETLLYVATEQAVRKDFHLVPTLSESGKSAVMVLNDLKSILTKHNAETQFNDQPEFNQKVSVLLEHLTGLSGKERGVG